MIFESHAHYDDEAFDEDRKELLDALPAQGIGRVINVCAEDLRLCRGKVINIRQQFKNRIPESRRYGGGKACARGESS